MKELESYLVEFNKNGIIKAKEYLSNYAIESSNSQLIIVIIYNESIFSANNSI